MTMLQARLPSHTAFWLKTEAIPTLYASEDFEGTETLLRKEIKEGWQEPKEECE